MDKGEIVLYQPNDMVAVEVRLREETVWLSLDQMAELFQRDKSTVSRHIKNVFEEGELDRNSVVAKFATTAVDGKTYQVDYHNLDVIISVGYRVKSLHRFLIIDNTVYHIGASLKDLGKKLFAFSKMEIKPAELLKNA